MSSANGNKFKGNKQKKEERGGKRFANFDTRLDQYARIVNIDGGRHMTVLPLDSIDKKTISVIIPGRFHKRVWFKKDEIIIIANGEVRGKVTENEMNRIRAKFDKLEGDQNNSLIFGDDVEDSDQDDEQLKEKIAIPLQPKKDYDLNKITKQSGGEKPDDGDDSDKSVVFDEI
jgi:hypothetical protein